MTTDSTASTATAPTRAHRASSTSGAVVPPSKSDAVIKLLLRGKGATSLELITVTDWQAHSIRAFLSGLRKKGRVIVREARKSGELAYRIEAAAKVPADGLTAAAVTQAPEPSA